jgi:hypothetical protein
MNWKNTTLIVAISIPLIIVAILIYDAFAVYFGGTEASISSLIITASYNMPFMVAMICYFNGLLHGHLFWRMKGNKDTRSLGLDEKLK